MEAACALTVEAEILGVGLGNEELEALLDEVADGPVVCTKGTRSEALVGAVEEGELLPLLHDSSDLLPLFLRGVNACGVVCASVKKDNASFWCGPECADHAIKVKTLGVLAEVWVVLDRQVDVVEDLVVVCPCWRAEVDRLGFRCGGIVELLEEETTKVVGTSAGDGLEGCDTLLGDGGGVGAEDEFLRGGCEVCETGDGEVLVVEVWVGVEDVVGLLEVLLVLDSVVNPLPGPPS